MKSYTSSTWTETTLSGSISRSVREVRFTAPPRESRFSPSFQKRKGRRFFPAADSELLTPKTIDDRTKFANELRRSAKRTDFPSVTKNSGKESGRRERPFSIWEAWWSGPLSCRPNFSVAAQGFSCFWPAGEESRPGDFPKNGVPFPRLIAGFVGRT